MRIWRTLSVLVVLTLFGLPVRADHPLTLMTEDYAPLNYVEDGTLKGPSIQIVQRILEILGEPAEIKVYPWSRAYTLVSEHPDHALFSMTRTPEREDLFKWVGPLAVKKHGFYIQNGSDLVINALEDAKPLRVGVQLKGVDDSFLTTAGFNNLDRISNWQLNATKLASGRIDAWFASTSSASLVIAEQDLVNRIRLAHIALRRPLYIAFSKATPDHEIQRWQMVLNQVYADGTAWRLFEEAGLQNLYPDPSDIAPQSRELN